MTNIKPLQIGKAGTVVGLNCTKGCQAEVLMDAGDVFIVMNKIYKNDKKNPSLDRAFKALEKRYFNSTRMVLFNAQIATKGVKFIPTIIEHNS